MSGMIDTEPRTRAAVRVRPAQPRPTTSADRRAPHVPGRGPRPAPLHVRSVRVDDAPRRTRHERAVARSMSFANGQTWYGRSLPLVSQQDGLDHRLSPADNTRPMSYPFDGDAAELPATRRPTPANGTRAASARSPRPAAAASSKAHLLGDAVMAGRVRMASEPRPGQQPAPPPVALRSGSVATHGALALASRPLRRTESSAQAAPPRPQLKVVSGASGGRSVGTYIAAGFLVLAALLFAAVVLHASLAQHQQTIDTRNTQIADAEQVHDRLRVEVARLESPARIASEAERMGLRPPQTIRFVNPNATGTGGLTIVDAADPSAAGADPGPQTSPAPISGN